MCVCVCAILLNHYLNCTAPELGGVICMIYVSGEYIVPSQWKACIAWAYVTYARVPVEIADDNYSKLNCNTWDSENYYYTFKVETAGCDLYWP